MTHISPRNKSLSFFSRIYHPPFRDCHILDYALACMTRAMYWRIKYSRQIAGLESGVDGLELRSTDYFEGIVIGDWAVVTLATDRKSTILEMAHHLSAQCRNYDKWRLEARDKLRHKISKMADNHSWTTEAKSLADRVAHICSSHSSEWPLGITQYCLGHVPKLVHHRLKRQ